MLLSLNTANPQQRLINMAVEIVNKGGVIIFPTDSVYALGCSANNNKAIERVCRILGKKPEKANLSLICKDLSNLSEYTTPINTSTFKIMRRALPGPFTFVLKANSSVPKIFKANKKTVGIRVPDNTICQALLGQLEFPLVSASVHSEDEILDYITEPDDIYDKYKKLIDVMLDGGVGDNQPSTVVDFTDVVPTIMRQGKGVLEV
jgi:tRNA threonylcarbamoyl adenosine modification protein (Sua5/YciO/YrdC/YwlC family)